MLMGKLDRRNYMWHINTMLKISKKLREVIEEKEKTSIRHIAKVIGVDHGSLYRALRDGGNPEGKTIEKILDYLGYEIRFTKSKKKEVKKDKQGTVQGLMVRKVHQRKG